MEFQIEKGIEILHNTPNVVKALLSNLSEDWIKMNEGEHTWSPFQIVGHFIHTEKAHWISRVRIILAGDEEVSFKLFSGLNQFLNSEGKSISELMAEFTELRNENIRELKSYNINSNNLLFKATHPEFGKVTLKQVLSAWIAHDLNHTKQIARVMASQYKPEMGPWEKYIKIK
ncbi:MAG: DinB family protein [Calditrichaeota bacterium]|nr:MAG: DinB family protein [Calditrichota bacterium]MBL1207275.1 DinB family protein [Calditrichota bacterium]NOG47108.1 DinB family protein [Calditrichota bacterium]